MTKEKFIPPVRVGDRLELTVDTQGSSGDGISRYEGYTLFVPTGLPGDRVLGEVVKVTPRFGVTRVVERLEESKDRVDPPCPVFPECAGCKLQDLHYEKQLAFKIQVATDALKHIGKMDPPGKIQTLPADPLYHYRNKASFAVQQKAGTLRIGFFQQRSHEVVDSDRCDVLMEPINEIKEWIRERLVKHRVVIYDETRHQGFLRGLVVRRSLGTRETLVGLVTTRGKFPSSFLRDLENPEFLDRFQVAGVVQNINPKKTNIILGDENRILWGENRLIEKLDGLIFQLSLSSFFQINTYQTVRLYNLVKQWALPSGGTIVDAYCGVGGIALWLARTGARVVGIEEFLPTVKDARLNARLNEIDACTFLQGPVEAHLEELLKSGEVETVVLDPPRKGCSEEVMRTLSLAAPGRIIYISCNPATLARDLSRLDGYRIEDLAVIDMFPQTQHVETAVLLKPLRKIG